MKSSPEKDVINPHPLMHNNITKADLIAVIKLFKLKNKILTQSKYVKKFEKKWSKWLGAKYSTFVNSGSSANFITISILKILNKDKEKNEIIVPSLTWVSDINSVIMNGFKPVFVDINFSNLSMNVDEVIKKISKKTLAVFITHAQGFNGLSKEQVETLNIWANFLYSPILEDKIRPIGEVTNGIYGRETAEKVHKKLREVGGVQVPREFVFMDRAALGLGSVFLHLKAEINWYKVFNEMIEGFNVEKLESTQKQALEKHRLQISE